MENDKELMEAVSVTVQDESGREVTGKVEKVMGNDIIIKANTGQGYESQTLKNVSVKDINKMEKFQK